MKEGWWQEYRLWRTIEVDLSEGQGCAMERGTHRVPSDSSSKSSITSTCTNLSQVSLSPLELSKTYHELAISNFRARQM
jgi:hypothetical protein